jgi:hypothetical protein
MATEQPKYTVLYQPGTPMARTAETILCWGFLGFLVWLGKDSTWWTFVFGTVAIFGLAGRFKYIYDNYTKRFSTKAELRAFVDSLPDAE